MTASEAGEAPRNRLDTKKEWSALDAAWAVWV